MRSCLTCGEQSPVGAQFCISCGAVMSLAAEGPTQRMSAGLAAEGPTQYLAQHQLPQHQLPLYLHPLWLTPLLQFGIVILVLYSVLILWPSYESGIAWYEGDPKGQFDAYETWYESWIPSQPTGLIGLVGLPVIVIVLTIMVTILVVWLLWVPLGIVMLLWVGANWSKLLQRERMGILLIGVLEIVVPVLTWTASYQFMRWFVD